MYRAQRWSWTRQNGLYRDDIHPGSIPICIGVVDQVVPPSPFFGRSTKRRTAGRARTAFNVDGVDWGQCVLMLTG